MTSDTSGQSSSISLASANLQSSLESKLRQQLEWAGSTIYRQTWKTKATPQGWQYCQLTSSVPRTKETDSSTQQNAWPTPAARDFKGQSGAGRQERKGHPTDTLPNAAEVSGWPTPMTADNRDRGSFDDPAIQRRLTIGKSIELSMLVGSITGESQQQYSAEMGSTVKYQLNPRFSLWLMGYPIEWAHCAERVTLSSRK